MIKLRLNESDRVRNINAKSRRYKSEGVVYGVNEHSYLVVYSNGIHQAYCKESAHWFLEKIEDAKSKCQCVHDELCYKCARGVTEELNQMLGSYYGKGRKTLKKTRRNVLNGKTQQDYIRDMGYARGVQEFNTRCLGRTTAQAFHLLYSCIDNPNMKVRITGDHAVSDYGIPTHAGDHNLRVAIEGIVRKLDLKGIEFDHNGMTFHPIVTEEVYVSH